MFNTNRIKRSQNGISRLHKLGNNIRHLRCTPTHPSLQTKQLFEVFPSGRQNCAFQPRNDCVTNKTASYGWICEDGQDPVAGTETKSIVCPVSCTKYCPQPDSANLAGELLGIRPIANGTSAVVMILVAMNARNYPAAAVVTRKIPRFV